MKKQQLFSLAAVAALTFGGLTLTGCAEFKKGWQDTDAAARKVALTATAWELEEDSLPGVDKKWQEPEKDITLNIDANGGYRGCAGVNSYFGTAKIDYETHAIHFGDAGVTMMAGPGMEYEQLYLKTLRTVDRFSFSDDDLYLYSGNTMVAKFDRKD